MVRPGTIALLAGAIVTFAVGGDLAVVGAITMILGAVLLIVGILRLNRARRQARGAAPRGPEGKTSTGKKIAMIAAVLYIISPLDFIPDVFFPIGLVDDAGVFGWLLFALRQEATRRAGAKRRAI